MGGSPVGLWFCKSALPTDLLPSFSEIPAACVGLLFFPLSTLPLASLAVLAFGIITITWWLSGIEASFKVLCKHCMISLARRIFSPSIEKGPHKKEWFLQARWHKHILKGPPSSVLLWPQADGEARRGEACVTPSLGCFLSCPWAGLTGPLGGWTQPESADCMWWRWISCGQDLVPLLSHKYLVPAMPH